MWPNSIVAGAQTGECYDRLVLELAAKKGKKVVMTSSSDASAKANGLPFGDAADLIFGPTACSILWGLARQEDTGW